MSVSGNFKTMHCGILFNMPYWMSNIASLNSESAYISKSATIGAVLQVHCNWLLYLTCFLSFSHFPKCITMLNRSGLNTITIYSIRSGWILFACELNAESLSPLMFAAKGWLRIWPIALHKTQAKGIKLEWNWRSGWQLALYDNKYTGIKTKNKRNLNHIWSICLNCMFTAQSRGSNYNAGKMDQTSTYQQKMAWVF